MTVLTGVFAALPGIENLSPNDILVWMPMRVEPQVIENYLGNRVIYPQTIATSKEDKLIDRAIFQEYIRRNPAFFYNPLSHKVSVPRGLYQRIQPANELMMILCSLLQLTGVVAVIITEETAVKHEGAIIIADQVSAEKNISIVINGKESVMENNKIYHYPLEDQHIRVKIDGAAEILVQGGVLGLTIDLRKRG